MKNFILYIIKLRYRLSSIYLFYLTTIYNKIIKYIPKYIKLLLLPHKSESLVLLLLNNFSTLITI